MDREIPSGVLRIGLNSTVRRLPFAEKSPLNLAA